MHSTTKLLPKWRELCANHDLGPRLIPRDVTTRWNSSYDMLKVAVKYRPVIDDMVSDKKTKLRKYELDDAEWDCLKDLLRVLKVPFSFV